MQLLTAAGKLPVAGDDARIHCSVSDIPIGVTFNKAWVTFKTSKTQADPGLLQKTITTGFTLSDTTISFDIDLVPAETLLFIPNVQYVFDVQVRDNNNRLTTPVPDGTAVFQQQITTASA